MVDTIPRKIIYIQHSIVELTISIIPKVIMRLTYTNSVISIALYDFENGTNVIRQLVMLDRDFYQFY